MAEPQHANGFFAAWARRVLRFRWGVLVVLLAVTVGLGWAADRYLYVDNGVRRYTPDGAEAGAVLDRTEAIFGRDDFFLLLATGDAFSRPFAERLKALHAEVAALDLSLPSLGVSGRVRPARAVPPAADEFEFEGDAAGDDWAGEAGGSVVDRATSLINVSRVRRVGDALRVEKLMTPLPPAEALPALRADVLADRRLVGQVVGRAGRHAVIAVQLAAMSQEDTEQVYTVLRDLAHRHTTDGFEVLVSGGPAMDAEVNSHIARDMRVLALASAIGVLLVLAWVFHHLIAVLAPLLVVAISIVWTLGTMALLDLPVGLISAILPAFITCVGIGDSVHILSVFRSFRRSGMPLRAAVVAATAVTGVPVLFTSLTTVVGLLSFRMGSVPSVREMGVAGAIGVAYALLISLLFVPVALSFTRGSVLGARAERNGPLDRALRACLAASAPLVAVPGALWRRRNRVLGIAALLTLGCAAAWTLLTVAHDPLAWLPKEGDLRRGFDTLDTQVGGTMPATLLVEASGPLGARDLRLLRALERLESHVLSYRDKDGDAPVGNAVSLLDVVRESNQVMTDGTPAQRRLPADQDTVSQLLVLFETSGSDDLAQLTTVDYATTQMTFRVRWKEASEYGPLVEHVQAGLRDARAAVGDGVTIRPSGGIFMFHSLVTSLIGDLSRSFGMALAIVTLLMILVLRDPGLALVAMVPNLLPIGAVLAVMGLARIPIDTLLIASIAIGVAVDDTIHFLHHFQAGMRAHGDVERALDVAMRDAGQAMVVTSLVLILGFGAFMAASMLNVMRFGLLVSLTAALALLLDLVLLPALLRWLFARRERLGQRQLA